ncbi:hypothetical protein AWB67_07584 [Caballeronia terrestris]|uniref:Uncharacterized protein n=1 Tax=Caballeronia terrestris TaxID=1226301 RepID=A0A158L4S6_9BURK|nr:hypothetical protein AWB67_07584 [Caballeronia terrestris]
MSPDQLSWPIAVILPSRVAPIRMRWIVAGRCGVLLNIIGRVSATLTGRRAARAPSAASRASARMNSLPPKPPPIYGEISRTLSLGMPSVCATSARLQSTIWFEVQSVSCSPSQTAIDACGSIIACAWSGVVYIASSCTGALAKAPAKSPTADSGVPVFGLVAEWRALARSNAPFSWT